MFTENPINVMITPSELKKVLIKKTDISKELADVIVGNLANSPMGLGQLTKALLGIFPDTLYKIGDFVCLPVKSIPGWKADKDATIKSELCKNGYIVAQICSIDPHTLNPYLVKCTVVISEGNIGEVDWVTSDSEIIARLDNPAEIVDIIENVKTELPF